MSPLEDVIIIIILSLFITTASCQLDTLERDTFTLEEFSRALAIGQQNCSYAGEMLCTDCKTLSTCNQLATGEFYAMNVSSCAADETCSNEILSCTTEDNPRCSAVVDSTGFKCFAFGIFPDPYKCTSYHMCVPSADGKTINPMSLSCPPNFGFDPVTSTCRLNLTANAGKCYQQLVPIKCSNATKAATAQDPSVYYSCMKDAAGLYYPQIFRCTKNQQFIDGACRDLPLAPSVCTKRWRYADPTDCKVYYDCPGVNYRPSRIQCPYYRRFVYQKQDCVDFTCAPTATNTGVCVV